MMDDAEVSRAELGSQQHKNIKMNDDMHQIPELRIDPTFSESSSEGSNTTPSSSSNNKRKAKARKSKKGKVNKHREATQQRRCRIITILSSIPFVLSLVALLIVLTKDKEDTQTTMSAASAILDKTDHQTWPVSNTQLQMSMQPNDSPGQSNDDKADDYLTYDEVSDSTTTLTSEKCHEVEMVSTFTTWNLLRKDSSGFQSVESSFEMASNSDAVNDETPCLEEGEYLLIAMVSGDEGYYRITSNGMLIEEGQEERTSFSIPFVPRVQGKSAKAPFIDTRSPLILATPSPSDDSMVELVGESVKTAAVENDAPTYSPTSWYPTYSPTSAMPTYSPSATSTHDPISDMPTYSPSDTVVRHPTYEPTSKSTDTLHSPTYYPTEHLPTTDV